MKYAVLHVSYSAPTRVWVKSADVDVARAVTREMGVWFCVARGTVVGLARAVAARDVLDVVFDAARGDSVDVRTARSDFTVVLTRWVGFVVLFARAAALPSRVAAPAPQMHSIQDTVKIRIFFISGEILAKL